MVRHLSGPLYEILNGLFFTSSPFCFGVSFKTPDLSNSDLGYTISFSYIYYVNQPIWLHF